MSRDIYSPFLGRSYPDPAETEERAWQALGQLMHNLLNPEPPPGPPYTHTIRGPRVVYTRSGKLLYWEKTGPAYTLTEGK